MGGVPAQGKERAGSPRVHSAYYVGKLYWSHTQFSTDFPPSLSEAQCKKPPASPSLLAARSTGVHCCSFPLIWDQQTRTGGMQAQRLGLSQLIAPLRLEFCRVPSFRRLLVLADHSFIPDQTRHNRDELPFSQNCKSCQPGCWCSLLATSLFPSLCPCSTHPRELHHHRLPRRPSFRRATNPRYPTFLWSPN